MPTPSIKICLLSSILLLPLQTLIYRENSRIHQRAKTSGNCIKDRLDMRVCYLLSTVLIFTSLADRATSFITPSNGSVAGKKYLQFTVAAKGRGPARVAVPIVSKSSLNMSPDTGRKLVTMGMSICILGLEIISTMVLKHSPFI